MQDSASQEFVKTLRWTRSENGIFAGVCQGMAEALDIDVVLLRIGWVLSIFLLGFGVLFYIALALALPRRDKVGTAYDDKVLGVCSRIAQKTYIEVGLVRFLALIALFMSFGCALLAYVILYFVLPTQAKSTASDHY